MKRFTLVVCLIFALLLTAAVPVTANVGYDEIYTITPNSGYANGKTVTYTITGVNMSAQGDVRLRMSGESDIVSSSISSWTNNSIVCTIKITSSKETGTWDVVVRKSSGEEITKANAFTILSEMDLSSISPTSAQADDDDVDFTLTGSGLEDVEDVYLYNKNYSNITADDVDAKSATKVTGTFDLTDADDGTYKVCIKDSFNSIVCDLTFEVTTNEVGSIDISSSPSGASIFINGIANGTTPNTIDDLIVGSYKVILRKAGYEEWGKTVTVTADDTTEVDAKLYAAATATPAQTTNPTSAPTTPRTTRTTAKSTIKIPTTFAETPTTAASPVEPALIIGTIGLAFISLRKH